MAVLKRAVPDEGSNDTITWSKAVHLLQVLSSCHVFLKETSFMLCALYLQNFPWASVNWSSPVVVKTAEVFLDGFAHLANLPMVLFFTQRNFSCYLV